MSPNLAMLGMVAVLYSTGVFLLLERSLTRVLLGVLVISNATNVLILSAGGPSGGPPLVGVTAADAMSDPLPQAMILTAIVITLGVAAFVLALIYRSWVLDQHEDIELDPEDVRVATRAVAADPELDVAPGEQDYDSGDDVDVVGTGSAS